MLKPCCASLAVRHLLVLHNLREACSIHHRWWVILLILMLVECDAIKSKVIPVLFLTEHHTMDVYWGSGGRGACILALNTRWR